MRLTIQFEWVENRWGNRITGKSARSGDHTPLHSSRLRHSSHVAFIPLDLVCWGPRKYHSGRTQRHEKAPNPGPPVLIP